MTTASKKFYSAKLDREWESIDACPEIPWEIESQLLNYNATGERPCGFVLHILYNHLLEALQCCPYEYSATIRDIVVWCWHNLDADSWGDERKVERWLKSVPPSS